MLTSIPIGTHGLGRLIPFTTVGDSYVLLRGDGDYSTRGRSVPSGTRVWLKLSDCWYVPLPHGFKGSAREYGLAWAERHPDEEVAAAAMRDLEMSAGGLLALSDAAALLVEENGIMQRLAFGGPASARAIPDRLAPAFGPDWLAMAARGVLRDGMAHDHKVQHTPESQVYPS